MAGLCVSDAHNKMPSGRLRPEGGFSQRRDLVPFVFGAGARHWPVMAAIVVTGFACVARRIFCFAHGLFGFALQLLAGSFCLLLGISGPLTYLALCPPRRIVYRALHSVLIHYSTSVDIEKVVRLLLYCPYYLGLSCLLSSAATPKMRRVTAQAVAR